MNSRRAAAQDCCPTASASRGASAYRITPCSPITNVGRKFLTSASSTIAMRRLSSVSQRPSSRAAATAWSSPWMVSRMTTILQVVGRDAGAAQGRRISRSHNPRNRRRHARSVASGDVQTSIWPCWARSLIGRMARLMARLISPRRARPSRDRAASTMSRNFSAAGDAQPSRSPSQSASCTISSSSRRCTPSHLSRSPPLGEGRRRQARTARPIARGRRCRCGRLEESRPAARLFRTRPGRTQLMPARQNARGDRQPHLTPLVRASAGVLCLRVTGSFVGTGWAEGLLIWLNAGPWRRESAGQHEIGLADLSKILAIPS